MATVPAFASTPKLGKASLTAATGATELGLTAPTNIATVVTAGASGSYLRRVKVKSRDGAIGSAGIVRLFLYDATSYYLLTEIDLPTASAPSATVKSFESEWVTLDQSIPTGTTLVAAVTVAENINVICEYADY